MDRKKQNSINIIQTYSFNGKNGRGPMRQKPTAIKILPIKADTFGFKILSTIIPQNGAVTA